MRDPHHIHTNFLSLTHTHTHTHNPVVVLETAGRLRRRGLLTAIELQVKLLKQNCRSALHCLPVEAHFLLSQILFPYPSQHLPDAGLIAHTGARTGAEVHMVDRLQLLAADMGG